MDVSQYDSDELESEIDDDILPDDYDMDIQHNEEQVGDDYDHDDGMLPADSGYGYTCTRTGW